MGCLHCLIVHSTLATYITQNPEYGTQEYHSVCAVRKVLGYSCVSGRGVLRHVLVSPALTWLLTGLCDSPTRSSTADK